MDVVSLETWPGKTEEKSHTLSLRWSELEQVTERQLAIVPLHPWVKLWETGSCLVSMSVFLLHPLTNY